MFKKWFDIITDHRVTMRERMFRMVTCVCMIAVAFTMPMGRNIWNILLLIIALLIMALIMRISIRKGCVQCVQTGGTIITLLLLMLFPFAFFSAGGFYSGVPEWFVLCFIYVCVTLQGRRMVFFSFLCTVEVLLCYSLAFYFPDLVVPNTHNNALIDSAFSMIMVGLLSSMLLIFLSRMYEKENAISQQQKKEIEELNRAENYFFSSMSHEIRTPINTIIGLNEIILREDVSQEVAENARNIQAASKLLLSLINDILDISKIKSGKMEIVNVSYETGALFSEIVNIIWIKAQKKGLEFKLHVDPSIPSMLCGDEIRIKQILINLLNNAVKYTDEGTVTLSVRCERQGLNKVRVWYSVEDTGKGIKKENIPYLFSAFRRVDEEKNRYIEGSGLGLSIVQQLVTLMSGEISVNSVYTKGSKFIVMLDQDIVDEKELGIFTLTSRSRPRDGEAYRRSFEAPDAYILVVDDNDMNLMVVKKLLAETKAHVETASSGAECLRMTQIRRYDCILMDHLMPEMNGIECFRALRVQPSGLCHDVPVIALTANAGSDNQQVYRREGFSGYLAKPVSGALLEAAVLSTLPKNLVHLDEKVGQKDVEQNIMVFGQTQRRSIIITTDSVCDLPKSFTDEFGIPVCSYYVCTETGRFLDNREMKTEELLAYISSGRKAYSQPPDVDDYERFFADRLTEAQNVIHITMAKHVSNGYQNAIEAAKSFENVTVLDSGHLSSSLGLVVLCAAYMADHHADKDDIIKAVREMGPFISSAFIIDSAQMMCRSGRISKRVQVLCDALLLHPVLALKKSRMAVQFMGVGSFAGMAKKYIKRTLSDVQNIDRSILIITYSGIDDDKLQYIQEMVNRRCRFERVYLQKASSAIASNCGSGSFGLAFMKKADTAASFFQIPTHDIVAQTPGSSGKDKEEIVS